MLRGRQPALELLGKELGLFRDPVDKPILKLEDLPEKVLESMLAEAEAAAGAGAGGRGGSG